MAKLLLGSGSLQRSNSRRSALSTAIVPARFSGAEVVTCVLVVLVASCATGVSIDGDDVSLVPRPAISSSASGEDSTAGESAAGEGTTDDGEPSARDAEDEIAAELPPSASEAAEEGPDQDLPRGEQPGSEGNAPSDAEDPGGGDSDPAPSEDAPVPDAEPDVDGPGSGSDLIPPSTPAPDPSPEDEPPAPGTPAAGSEPEPPSILDPDALPIPVLPAEGHCLGGWEGSSCDTCSGQTQSDRLTCRLYIDCYIESDCDPVSCGGLEGTCGVNRLGNGLAPKDIADAVYACMCAP